MNYPKLAILMAFLAGSQLALSVPAPCGLEKRDIETVHATQTTTVHAPGITPDTGLGPVIQGPQRAEGKDAGVNRVDAEGHRKYINRVLQHHNVHRSNHSAPAIKWSRQLASTAQKIAATCNYAHDTAMDGGGYGQNIAAGVDASGIGRVISDMFYNGELAAFGDQYGSDEPNGFEKWGHFTQVVWKGTDRVGCATQHCPGGLANTGGSVPPYFTVCNYGGPGNVAGAYGQNVGRPLGRKTVSG